LASSFTLIIERFIFYLSIFVHNGGLKMHVEKPRLEKRVKTRLKALQLYAMQPEVTIENLATWLNKDYSTALRINKTLLNNGLVKLSRLERTADKGQEKRVYTITFLGLACYLPTALNPSEISQIARAHKDKLLIFRKWDKISQAGLADFLVANIKVALSSLFTYTLQIWRLNTGSPLPPQNFEQQARAFDIISLGLYWFSEPPKWLQEKMAKEWELYIRLLKLIKEDYELNVFMQEFLDGETRRAQNTLQNINEWKQVLASL
jgi:predicted transcriptional regulator